LTVADFSLRGYSKDDAGHPVSSILDELQTRIIGAVTTVSANMFTHVLEELLYRWDSVHIIQEHHKNNL
jgi:hypothetical protein